MDEKFLDPADGTYFYVDRDQETPLVRSKSIYDQVLPSGNSMAARVSLRLYRLTEKEALSGTGPNDHAAVSGQAQQNPWGFAHLWTVQALALTPPLDLTLVGDPGDSRTQALLRAAQQQISAGTAFGPERPGQQRSPWKNSCPGRGPTASRVRTRWPISAGISPACRPSATPRNSRRNWGVQEGLNVRF